MRDGRVTGVQTCALPIFRRVESGTSFEVVPGGELHLTTGDDLERRPGLDAADPGVQRLGLGHVLQDRKSVVEGKSGAVEVDGRDEEEVPGVGGGGECVGG